MADSELNDREEALSKKDRLINAWLAAGPDAMAKSVAEVTDSSVAYASRIESQMEDGDIGEDQVEEVRDAALVDEYAERLQRIAQDATGDDTDGTTESDADEPRPSEGADQRQPSAREAQRQHRERRQTAAQRETERQLQAPQGPEQSRQPPQQQPPQQQPPQQQPPQGTRLPSQQVQRGEQRATQPQSPNQQPPQQSRDEFPTDAGGAVPVERLRELDRLLAAFEEEAQFEIRHLPQGQAAEAVGKLFVAEKTRSLLREAVETDESAQTQ